MLPEYYFTQTVKKSILNRNEIYQSDYQNLKLRFDNNGRYRNEETGNNS